MRQLAKKTERAVIDFKKLMRQEFACDTDARKALQLWLEKREFIRIHDSEITRHEKRTKRGRPGLNDAVITTFQIIGNITSDLRLRNDSPLILENSKTRHNFNFQIYYILVILFNNRCILNAFF
jgi:transposase